MQDSLEITELDMQIIDSLNLSPRATWETVGAITGIDGTTASRRFARLREQGLAWTSCHRKFDEGSLLDHIEISCDFDHLDAAVHALSRTSECINLSKMSGTANLRALFSASTFSEIADIAENSLRGVPGIRGMEHTISTGFYRNGDLWQLGSLSRKQIDELRIAPRDGAGARREFSAAQCAIIRLLQQDCRISSSRIGQAVGLSVATVSRFINSLLATKELVFRVESSQDLAGWPISSTIMLDVDPGSLDLTASIVASLGGVRMCHSVLHPSYNLMVIMWEHAVDGVPATERRLLAALGQSGLRRGGDFDIKGRNFTLRSYKRAGQLLDRRGRSIGVVPTPV